MPKLNFEIKIFLAIIMGTLILIGGVSLLLGQNSPADTSTLVRNNSHSIGPANTKVTIVEFSDYECPACKSIQPVVAEVLKNYPNVRFVYREFPLPSHQDAFLAAQAAESAGLQGKFWEMHDKLFAISPNLSREQLMTAANDLGLNIDQFTKDLDSEAVRQIVLADQADGDKAGLSVTPTFFINGTKFDGGLTVEEFKKEIDSRLK